GVRRHNLKSAARSRLLPASHRGWKKRNQFAGSREGFESLTRFVDFDTSNSQFTVFPADVSDRNGFSCAIKLLARIQRLEQPFAHVELFRDRLPGICIAECSKAFHVLHLGGKLLQERP